MKQLLITIFSVGILVGCNQVEEATNEIENEAEEVEHEVEQSLDNSEEQITNLVNDLNNELEEEINDVDPSIVTEGDTAVINTPLLFPFNEEDYDELYGLIEQSNYERINEMTENGDVIIVEENTEVEVVDMGIRQAKVEILSSGKQGYIPAKYLAVNETS